MDWIYRRMSEEWTSAGLLKTAVEQLWKESEMYVRLVEGLRTLRLRGNQDAHLIYGLHMELQHCGS